VIIMNADNIVKINFADFWLGFNVTDNWFYNLLSGYYTLEISEEPDILIYSVHGIDHLKYNCIRIFYTGENIAPDYDECDFAISYDYKNTRRNIRVPLYALWYPGREEGLKVLLDKPGMDIEKIAQEKEKFCNIVVSNAQATKRISFFHSLSAYKKVDSGGKHLNNIGGPIAYKWPFIKQYKFSIAFENESALGYTTEKIVEPMLMHSIPIYWGNPDVFMEFNTKSFINWHDYNNDTLMIERIKEIDNDKKAYLEMLAEPWFYNNTPSSAFNENGFRSFLFAIIDNRKTLKPVASRKLLQSYVSIRHKAFDFYRRLSHKLNK
jgi:hypothetical protein